MTSPDSMPSPLAPGRLGPPNPSTSSSPMVSRVQQFMNQQYGDSSGGGPMRSTKMSGNNRFNPMMSPMANSSGINSLMNSITQQMNANNKMNSNVIFVYGIQKEMTNDELEKMFAPFGGILSCTVTQGKGYGFVHF